MNRREKHAPDAEQFAVALVVKWVLCKEVQP
jgi:hypothetical protein